jgi:hypothetical protein
MSTITIKTQYKNPLAQAAAIASNLAKSIRYELDRGQYDVVVDGWEELEIDGNDAALAVYRSTLSQQSKKVFGYGLKVENGKLVRSSGTRATKDNSTMLLNDAFAAFKKAKPSKEQKLALMAIIQAHTVEAQQ